MSESFQYCTSPILTPDDTPRRAWRGAPRCGARAPDPAVTLIEGPAGSETSPVRLRRLLGPGFVALYFAADLEDARQFILAASADRYPVGLAIWPVLRDAPRTCCASPVIWDYSGGLSAAFTAAPGTLFLIRPDGYIAARRRRIRTHELGVLVRSASANPASDPAGRTSAPRHDRSGFHSNWVRTP